MERSGSLRSPGAKNVPKTSPLYEARFWRTVGSLHCFGFYLSRCSGFPRHGPQRGKRGAPSKGWSLVAGLSTRICAFGALFTKDGPPRKWTDFCPRRGSMCTIFLIDKFCCFFCTRSAFRPARSLPGSCMAVQCPWTHVRGPGCGIS